MRKIISLLIFTFFVGISLSADAYISERRDDFDDSKHVESYNDVNYLDGIGLKKIITRNKDTQYVISLSSDVKNKEQRYSKKSVKLKMDDDIFEVKVLSSFQYSENISTCEVEMPVDLVPKLIAAQKVSMRFYRENGLVNTINIPDNVLAEWKEVIATES